MIDEARATREAEDCHAGAAAAPDRLLLQLRVELPARRRRPQRPQDIRCAEPISTFSDHIWL